MMFPLLCCIGFAAPADSPEFVVVSPADDRPVGKVVRLTRGFSVTLATQSGEITITDVMSLRRSDRVLPPFPTGPQLVTTGGDRIAGTLAGGDARSLRFRPAVLKRNTDTDWTIPLSSAAVVWFVDTPAKTPLDVSRYEWLKDVKNHDVLRLRNGDIARGTVDGLDPDAEVPTFPFRSDQGAMRAVAAQELAALAFNPALARFRRPMGPYARVVLTDGSRVSMSNMTIANDIVTGNSLFGQKLELPLAEVLALDVMAGKATYLSDLKPKKTEQSGFLGVAWPWAADRTVHGDELRVTTSQGVTTADKGLGTHPRTLLTYDLAGKYRRFEALVGIDPAALVRSKATVRVSIDGKERSIPALAVLTSGNAIPVRVDVRGAKELTLLIDFGPTGGVAADVNWCNARLIE